MIFYIRKDLNNYYKICIIINFKKTYIVFIKNKVFSNENNMFFDNIN